MSKSKKTVPKQNSPHVLLVGSQEIARTKITKESEAKRDNVRYREEMTGGGEEYRAYMVSIKVDKEGNVYTTIFAKGKQIVKGKRYLDLLPKIEKLISKLEATPGEAEKKGIDLQALKNTLQEGADNGPIYEHLFQQAIHNTKETVKNILKDKGNIPGQFTQLAIHGITQRFADSKQLTLFADEKIEDFATATGISLSNDRPNSYGVVLNLSQQKVFEGIMKAFSDSNYKGDSEEEPNAILNKIYPKTEAKEKLINNSGAPYKNIATIPVIKLTQSEIIELSGYSKTHGDKTDVIEAINYLGSKQFCFYWLRLKYDAKGKPVRDKNGNYAKEEVMEVGTLLRIKYVSDQGGGFNYYEISPSACLLDQLQNYFLLIPTKWREEVKQITGKKASRYTYELLLWLRLQYEQIRRYNSNKGHKNKKPFIIKKPWEEVAIALKMPETVYKANRKKGVGIIQTAYDVAIKLGYLIKVEPTGPTDILYLNESYYPKPGELK